jgi:type I restriction enzyme S subunit
MIASRATGVWGSNEFDERNTHCVEIIRAGDISQEGKLLSTATRFVSPEDFGKAKCNLDDLVITTSGAGLGKVWWCDGRTDVVASNFVRVLRPNPEKAVGRFLFYALRTDEGIQQLITHTATTAYPNLRPSYFSSQWIALPPASEQTAIATALSEMDTELTGLERRRDKTHAVKLGMMQELLTGRTRLL